MLRVSMKLVKKDQAIGQVEHQHFGRLAARQLHAAVSSVELAASPAARRLPLTSSSPRTTCT